MFLQISLCLPFLDKTDLSALLHVCRELRHHAQEELALRTTRLAKEALGVVNANPKNVILAGSMALWLKQKGPRSWFPNNADLFWFGTSETKYSQHGIPEWKVIVPKRKDVSFIPNVRPLVTKVLTRNGNLQFILSTHFETVEDVLKTFDLTCCRIACNALDQYIFLEGFELWIFYYARVPKNVILKQGRCNPTKMLALANDQRRRTFRRIQKYKARGFKCCGSFTGNIRIFTFSLLYTMPQLCYFVNRIDRRCQTENMWMNDDGQLEISLIHDDTVVKGNFV